VPRNHRLACEEVFGPVLSAIPFDDEGDAIRLANATDYGLIAAIWTKDGARQTRVAKAMRCGQVYINAYGAGGGVELPFGGVKKSGHGREKGFMALEEFCVVKTVVQYHGA
jgi:aldehyde dehydrogenase (NAD+)